MSISKGPFSFIIETDAAFARLLALVQDPSETPEEKKRREDKNASHTAFICEQCGQKLTAIWASEFDCRKCSKPHPDAVPMVRVSEATIAARPSKRPGKGVQSI